MHQYKTVAQILLILSIFNIVFAIPVEREIYDAHDGVVVPVVVRNVAAMSKERRHELDGTPSVSSPPPPDVPPSDEPAPLHESLSPPPGEPAALGVSSPPGGTASLPTVPATNQPVPVRSTSTSPYTAVTHNMLDPDPEAEMQRSGRLAKAIIVGGTIIIITGGFLWNNRNSLRRRTIDPDWYVSNPSRLSCRRL